MTFLILQFRLERGVMQKEIEYAVNFLATIIQKHGITSDQVSVFKQALTLNLKEKIGKCWYPAQPIQVFRI